MLVIGGWLGWIVRSPTSGRRRGGDHESRWLGQIRLGMDKKQPDTDSKNLQARMARGSHRNRLHRSRHRCLAHCVPDSDRRDHRTGRASHTTATTEARSIVRSRHRSRASDYADQAPRLNLDGTRISDAGLAHLKELTKLSSLDINGSQVTEAGVRDLQQALPSLKIYR